MVSIGALVIYKNKPAIVKDRPDDKFSIVLEDGESLKVREKDIEPLHSGPLKDFKEIAGSEIPPASVREAWELLLDDGEESVSLKDLAGLIGGEYTPSSAYAAYCAVKDGLYFSGSIAAIVMRTRDEAAADEAKRCEKQRETGERAQFLEQLKASIKNSNQNIQFDAHFMQDIEALAYGKSVKSRTMKDIGLSETPEDAHAILLKTGFWTASVNPHPARFGIQLTQPSGSIAPPPPEERRDLCHLDAYAIDSPWSTDPDDAVSIDADKNILYVHVADPASSITPDSPLDREARGRGATLYLPEATVRMLPDEALPLFALGLDEKSPALTFKMTLDENGGIACTEIFPSIVKVKRITYEEADKLINNGCSDTSSDASALRALMGAAERNFKRRLAEGAVNIDLPETRITVDDGEVSIEPVNSYRSASLVRECMLIAGEGAGGWASERALAFPYISQEVEITEKIPSGMAGSYQLRRCMRPRSLLTKPGRHWGLGLETYTQVTSPLRRYTDLLAHMQIRAFLAGAPLSADEISPRLGAGEAAVAASVHAERASRGHWTMCYLGGKKDSKWEAVALEKKGSRWAMIIPALALETQVPLQKDVSPNDIVELILKSVNIPRCEASFAVG